jgi:hypothetical protein
MKPTNAELCAALVIIRSNPAANYIRPETIDRLTNLGLLQLRDNQIQLTSAGRLLSPSLESGDTLPNLE